MNQRTLAEAAADKLQIWICSLDKGFQQWLWLCPRCQERRKAMGWTVARKRTGDLTCDDCKRKGVP